MDDSHPNDYLQIARKFNKILVNVSVGTVQNFTPIFQVLFELRVFE